MPDFKENQPSALSFPRFVVMRRIMPMWFSKIYSQIA